MVPIHGRLSYPNTTVQLINDNLIQALGLRPLVVRERDQTEIGLRGRRNGLFQVLCAVLQNVARGGEEGLFRF